MIQISKRSQFFSPGSDFALSSLSSSDKSKIQYILGIGLLGTLVKWDPTLFFPALSTLRKDRSYIIRSNISSGSFAPYDLPIVPGGQPEHDQRIAQIRQFFTYRGQSNFSLNQLSADVKARILRINGEGSLPSSDMVGWKPGQIFPILTSFVAGRTYLVESLSTGFSPYLLGVPDPPAENPIEFLNDSLLPDVGLIPAEYVGV